MMRFLLSAGIFTADQYCKHKIDEKRTVQDKKILKDMVTVTRHRNQGVFLNALSGQKNLILVLTSILFGGLLVLSTRHRSTGLALLTGGAASNLWDRYRKGYVVDYFTFRKLPKIVFNLGDLAIFLGILLCIPKMWDHSSGK